MISAYLKDTVSIKTLTYDKWGEATASTTSAKARIEYGTKMVMDSTGSEAVSSARILLKPNVSIDHNCLIYFDTRDHEILSINYRSDFSTRLIEVSVA